MLKFIIFSVLTLSMYKMANCQADPHLCIKQVVVNYTEIVTKPIQDYGSLAKYFEQLNIPAGNKTVTKTKMEDQLQCCENYIKSANGKCVMIQTSTSTTTKATTTEYQDSTTSKLLDTFTQPTQTNASNLVTKESSNHNPLIWGIICGICILAICIAAVITLRIRRRRGVMDIECQEVKFDTDMQRDLLEI
ncbi:uncharacterized protein LOC108098341 [Drosophila ficusphila]|uniref:uncharacterized protein LOC108098341 n=1 Tax=Drosophila ficusphila TaxID=30025 RepID=UPI0007E89136|nr:uncharacterized protein LOC108098341 [Drosophila ficusphila]